jgi:hypothetical protein
MQDESFTNYLAAHECFPALGNWNCQETSTEFALDTGSRVVGVIMKAPGVATAEGYEGTLPAEITFDDTPEELVAKLGRPIAGSAKPGSFLKWDGGQVALFVNFFNSAPLRVADVRLALDN